MRIERRSCSGRTRRTSPACLHPVDEAREAAFAVQDPPRELAHRDAVGRFLEVDQDVVPAQREADLVLEFGVEHARAAPARSRGTAARRAAAPATGLTRIVPPAIVRFATVLSWTVANHITHRGKGVRDDHHLPRTSRDRVRAGRRRGRGVLAARDAANDQDRPRGHRRRSTVWSRSSCRRASARRGTSTPRRTNGSTSSRASSPSGSPTRNCR